MMNLGFLRIIFSISAILLISSGIFAQNNAAVQPKSREVSESDGIPVLTKHLPQWESTLNRATYILNENDLRSALGDRPVFDLVDFETGTEAVTAPYDAGKLLIIEYTTPQASIDADQRINQRLAELGQPNSIAYRRIGNYNAFVFDVSDTAAANVLLDQIKYEKIVQWLGEDPFLLERAERALVQGLSQVFIATVFAIVGGLALSVLLGLMVGYMYFRWLEKRRAGMKEFSDAGGMTRLNLDGFTPPIASNRLLNK